MHWGPRKWRYEDLLARDGRLPDNPSPLTGAIPPQLGQLTRLRHLDLSGHLLSGTFPAELGRLASLEYLDLGDNWLTGPLPPALGQLPRLQTLKCETVSGIQYIGPWSESLYDRPLPPCSGAFAIAA